MAAFSDTICHTKRIISQSSMIDIYFNEDVVKNKYLVKAYLSNPPECYACKFEKYEDARACYILATTILTSKNVDFDRLKEAIINW